MRLAQSPVATEELEIDLESAPTSAGEALDVVGDQLGDIWRGILESLPIIVIGVIVLVIALVVALAVARTVRRGLDRARMDRSVANLLARMARLVLIITAVLFSLSVVGVSVTSVVALLAVAGIAVGLAVQGILENFIAGVILLMRKPFRTGDQIITGDYEGTVDDIDFRVTRLVGYDGTVNLIPNGQVYGNPIVNLTTRGTRRTTVTVGVDYRDDHDRARDVIAGALADVDGVLAEPPSEVLLTALADSSVNFELRYWTRPDIRSVRHTQDRVLSAVKRAIEDAGMTIPWPIRTLVVDPDSHIALRDHGRAGSSG
ncbi:mechanosensitive ion channel family protein [Euzebya sp.]|uniref:mechanosensitive ion channel family protein n=1 Tax=Euzebya sp. TaxID=1971409 RepID=UPI0035160A9F